MALFDAETIVLNEEASVAFIRELVHPNSDYISKRDAVFESIDGHMTISECDDGFIVDVCDLEYPVVEAQEHHEVEVCIKISPEVYVALMKFARGASSVYNCIVSSEKYSSTSTWNIHGETTESKLSVAPQTTNNDAKYDSNGNLDWAA